MAEDEKKQEKPEPKQEPKPVKQKFVLEEWMSARPQLSGTRLHQAFRVYCAQNYGYIKSADEAEKAEKDFLRGK